MKPNGAESHKRRTNALAAWVVLVLLLAFFATYAAPNHSEVIFASVLLLGVAAGAYFLIDPTDRKPGGTNKYFDIE
jgi:hypothetical protein